MYRSSGAALMIINSRLNNKQNEKCLTRYHLAINITRSNIFSKTLQPELVDFYGEIVLWEHKEF